MCERKEREKEKEGRRGRLPFVRRLVSKKLGPDTTTVCDDNILLRSP